MNNTKENQTKLQVIISVLVLTVILFAEMYLMINAQDSYLAIILLAVVALAAVYVLVNAIMTLAALNEAKREEHFESLHKSDKASYIMLKKSFDEIEERLNELQENSKIPTEELINAQKGIAKVIINRSKENADAIINSNDQVLERLDEVEETQNTNFTSLSKEQHLEISDVSTQTEMKLKDLLVQLKDTELRLNQAIMSGTKVVSVPTYIPEPQKAEINTEAIDPFTDLDMTMEAASVDSNIDLNDIPLDELFPAEEPVAVEEPVLEEVSLLEEPALEEVSLFEEPALEEVSLFEEPVLEEVPLFEEPVIEAAPVEEEKPPMPDLSDPNKAMSPDDIAALFANMAPAEEPAPVVEEPVIEEPVIEEVPVEEEKPPMPDLSDPNKVMSPDEIAALIANL